MPAPGATMASRTCPAFGTYATLLTTDPAAIEPAAELLTAELRAVDEACSRFRPDSELSKVNQAAGQPVRVSSLFTEALTVALTAARLTDGDVDPTCGGSLIRLGYDRDFAQVLTETSTLRQPAVPAPGWRSVELDPVLRQVSVPAGTVLDLGATAKALAADRAATRIAAALRCGVLVNLGGDIRVAGAPPDDGWLVGIADDAAFAGTGDSSGSDAPASLIRTGHPKTPPEIRAVVIRDGGLATSGTMARTWQRGPARLHHIMVPGTGLPAASCWRAVSVAAATCVAANTASTAAIIRGERAPAWLAGLRLPARLVRHDGTALTLAGWPADPGRPADDQ